jgi:isopentenyl diphosphate isomerase/L-lactate dehydrogenase-like FMN-dependent dehydrogenase
VSEPNRAIISEDVYDCHRHRLNKISQASTASTILGMPSSLPIFIAPAALARLGHPDGEMNLVRAAGRTGILQGVSDSSGHEKGLLNCHVDL